MEPRPAGRVWSGLALLFAGWASVSLSGQPARRVTNLDALQSFPGFYHLRPLTLAGTVAASDNGRLRLEAGSSSIRVVSDAGAPDGPAEVRGEFWDVGRMSPDDPRLAAYDLRGTFGFDPEGPWPRPGQVLALIAGDIVPAAPVSSPTIRSLVLHPARFLDQRVTITGQFSGRNLLGELPDTPANSRFDFVLRSADAAIWVSHIAPRGRTFDLALDARVDTGRWLTVSGVLQQGRGLQWLDASSGSVELASPPESAPVDAAVVTVPAGPPPEVLFSAPAHGEIEVERGTNVRLQFSRDIDAATLGDRVRAAYVDESAAAPPQVIEIRTEYRPGVRALEITPVEPLAPYRTVQVELLEGILGTDGQALPSWVLTFSTGG